MRSRKNSREVEAYSVANKSQYGWMTEKFYRQGELFEKESDDVWYEKDDLTTDKKLSMWRNAEREAKYAMVHCIVWMSMTVFLHEIVFLAKEVFSSHQVRTCQDETIKMGSSEPSSP